MSYASENKRANPATLGAAILLNGSIVVAIALSPMVAEVVKRDEFFGRSIELKPEPLPDDPKPEPKTDQQQVEQKIFQPETIVDTNPPPTGPTTTTEQEEVILTTNAGGGDEGGADGFREPIKPSEPIFNAAMRDPRFARDFQPAYPPGLLSREVEGKAVVKVLIGIDGRVRQVVVLSATHPDFGKATERQALREWRFNPATRDGVPVEDWQTLTVRFDIS